MKMYKIKKNSGMLQFRTGKGNYVVPGNIEAECNIQIEGTLRIEGSLDVYEISAVNLFVSRDVDADAVSVTNLVARDIFAMNLCAQNVVSRDVDADAVDVAELLVARDIDVINLRAKNVVYTGKLYGATPS
jgi:hypothetical protein